MALPFYPQIQTNAKGSSKSTSLTFLIGLSFLALTACTKGKMNFGEYFKGLGSLNGADPMSQNATVTVSLLQVKEGAIGLLNIRLSHRYSNPVEINYLVETNKTTAQAFSDYIPLGGTVIFSPGETVRDLVFVANYNGSSLSDSVVTLSFSNAQNLALPASEGSVSIINIDAPQISPGAVTVSQVEVAHQHGCAVLSGKAYCWGKNTFGEVGNGDSTVPVLKPTLVSSIPGTVTKVSVGGSGSNTNLNYAASCAISINAGSSELRCWGSNGGINYLGRPDTLEPGEISGFATGITDISMGESSSCLIRNGLVYCWGLNPHGQLGVGDFIARSTPTLAGIPLTKIAESVSVGSENACAITHDAVDNSKQVWCWGGNSRGQLGIDANGTSIVTSSVPTLVTIPTLPADPPRTISVGVRAVCGIFGTSLYCWGDNSGGLVGSSVANLEQQIPFANPTLSSSVNNVQLSRIPNENGSGHACAVKSGAVYCWGDNSKGQLGFGPISSIQASSTPTLVPSTNLGAVNAPSGSFMQLALGSSATCGEEAGKLKCWGNGFDIQIGTGVPGHFYQSREPLGLQEKVTQVASNLSSTCAVSDGRAKCWGDNSAGQLGVGDQQASNKPLSVAFRIPANLSVSKIVMSNATSLSQLPHSCALISDGTVLCWGDNKLSQLGDVSTISSGGILLDPFPVTGVNNAKDLIITNGRSCIINSTNDLICWGLGSPVPTPVTSAGKIKKAALAENFSCVITEAAEARCTGSNFFGQIGNGTNVTTATGDYVLVSGLSSGIVDISVFGQNSNQGHACAIQNNEVKCWGDGFGATGLLTNVSTPATVGNIDETPIQVVTGESTSCVLLKSGKVRCWGQAIAGGWGHSSVNLVATDVIGLSTGIKSLSITAGNSMCAVTELGSLKCWGTNDFGLIGLGVNSVSEVPNLISFISGP